jgi:hypothetical protein
MMNPNVATEYLEGVRDSRLASQHSRPTASGDYESQNWVSTLSHHRKRIGGFDLGPVKTRDLEVRGLAFWSKDLHLVNMGNRSAGVLKRSINQVHVSSPEFLTSSVFLTILTIRSDLQLKRLPPSM